jgi:hypothetical protein
MHMQPALPRFAALLSAAVLSAAALAQSAAAPSRDGAANADAPTTVAEFDGLWCGTGLLHEFSLRLRQRREDVLGTLVRRDKVREIEGRVRGTVLHTQNTKIGSLLLERAGDVLRITGGDGIIALARGATFQRAPGSACAG